MLSLRWKMLFGCVKKKQKKNWDPYRNIAKIIYNEQKYSEFCYQLSLAICWLRRYIKFFFETTSKCYLKLEYCLKVKSQRWHTSAMFMTNWYFWFWVFGHVRDIFRVAMPFISALLNETWRFRRCWKKLFRTNVFHYLMCFSTCKSSRSQMFFKLGVFKNTAIYRNIPDISVGVNVIKKRPQHRCFPVNTAKFLRRVKE